MTTNYPIRFDLEVAWGEMDCLGHVNNACYLRYFESARILYLTAIGLPYQQHILVSLRCGFRQPVMYPDRLRCEAGCTRLDGSGFTLSYRLYSYSQEVYVTEGNSGIVYYDYASRKSGLLPANLAEAIAKLES